jgi:uncharacterized protein YeaO (DUF488 family)
VTLKAAGKEQMQILIKRIYDPSEKRDGLRILVDRLWPRGLKKEQAVIHEWLKDIAPSDSLRKWFSHDPKKWQEFKSQYFKELKEKNELIKGLAERARDQTVTLLYSAKDLEFNNAVALKEYLEREKRG